MRAQNEAKRQRLSATYKRHDKSSSWVIVAGSKMRSHLIQGGWAGRYTDAEHWRDVCGPFANGVTMRSHLIQGGWAGRYTDAEHWRDVCGPFANGVTMRSHHSGKLLQVSTAVAKLLGVVPPSSERASWLAA